MRLTVAGGLTQEQNVDRIAPAWAEILDHAASLLSREVVLEVVLRVVALEVALVVGA